MHPTNEPGAWHSLRPVIGDVCIPAAGQADLGTGYLSSAFGAFSVGSEPSSSGFSVKDLSSSVKLDEARVRTKGISEN